MKLSALLVTVNLVAIPIAAQAAEEAISDKAEWIKRNLACTDNTLTKSQRKVSLSDPGVYAKGKRTSLQPFVPNRHLPSKRELETVLLAQQAHLDTTGTLPNSIRLVAQQPITEASWLEGQISAYSLTGKLPATSTSSYPKGFGYQAGNGKATSNKPRAMSGQVATIKTTPEVNLNPAAPHPTAYLPDAVRDTQFNQETAAHGLNNPASSLGLSKHLVEEPSLSKDEQSMLDELVELNYPGRFAQFQELPGRATTTFAENQPAGIAQNTPAANIASSTEIGPPPFPLNLLPQEALQDLIGKKNRRHVNAPRAYFGSWHNPIAYSHLPPAGFVSHITSGRISQGNFNRLAQRISVTPHMTIKHQQFPQGIMETSRRTLCSNHLATYPSYQALSFYGPFRGQTRLSMF